MKRFLIYGSFLLWKFLYVNYIYRRLTPFVLISKERIKESRPLLEAGDPWGSKKHDFSESGIPSIHANKMVHKISFIYTWRRRTLWLNTNIITIILSPKILFFQLYFIALCKTISILTCDHVWMLFWSQME